MFLLRLGGVRPVPQGVLDLSQGGLWLHRSAYCDYHLAGPVMIGVKMDQILPRDRCDRFRVPIPGVLIGMAFVGQLIKEQRSHLSCILGSKVEAGLQLRPHPLDMILGEQGMAERRGQGIQQGVQVVGQRFSPRIRWCGSPR